MTDKSRDQHPMSPITDVLADLEATSALPPRVAERDALALILNELLSDKHPVYAAELRGATCSLSGSNSAPPPWGLTYVPKGLLSSDKRELLLACFVL